MIVDEEIGLEQVVVKRARWPLSVQVAWINLLNGRCSVTEKAHCIKRPTGTLGALTDLTQAAHLTFECLRACSNTLFRQCQWPESHLVGSLTELDRFAQPC